MRFRNNTDQVTIANRFSGSGDGTNFVQTLRFADGTTVNLASPALALENHGTAASDTLLGYSGNDVIRGYAGNDVIYGYGGNDTLIGGAGNEGAWGGDGDDLIDFSADGGDDGLPKGAYGELGNDTLIGGSGKDSLNGGEGNDSLSGRGGNDTLDGLAGDDTLAGGAGNDALSGNAGSDVYLFNPGDGMDTIYGDSSDVLHFGAGLSSNDLYFASFNNNLHLRFCNSTDEVVVAGRFNGVADGATYLPTVDFADGTVVNLSNPLLALETVGTSAAEWLNG